jgi:glycosyltransferase involved in cell wall biosynthesis
MDLTIIIPCHNEAGNLPGLIQDIQNVMNGRPESYEIIIVDDASTDDTADTAKNAGCRVVSHPYNLGNGAAVKSGIRAATGDIVLMMDGDGQHRPEVIPSILEELKSYDLVVCARSTGSHAGVHRLAANTIYNWLASYVTKFRILDLTSGFRATRRQTALRYLYLLPNTFSYPTTMTMAFLRSGLSLKYIPINAPPRGKGSKSKIRLFSDGAKFLLIITKIATIFSPFRVFLPLSGSLFFTGSLYYLYTFITTHRFTNMSMLLFATSVIIFMLGLVSEQISQLRMDRSEGQDAETRGREDTE